MSTSSRLIDTSDRPVVCVQGLGFVGMAMATAVASVKKNDQPLYSVIGVDRDNELGREKVEAVNTGRLPLVTTDTKLEGAFQQANQAGNLTATTKPEIYATANIIVVDVHLDVIENDLGQQTASFGGFKKAIQTVGEYAQPGTLILVETTVPPGTCEKVVAPTLAKALEKRGLAPDSLHIAHSYERVMPGKNYYNSIVNFYRVYSGHTETAADLAEAFLSDVINVADYPLTRLHSTTASETAKVLENTYRATNIAFIHEWGRFAESVGVNLFEVLDAIRMRPTHNNIRQPGFGVGGYCLTKDPHFVNIAARELFDLPNMEFPFGKIATETNKNMPVDVLDRLEKLAGGSLQGKRILLLGVSYRQDVGDTRYSPSEIFVREAESRGATFSLHDPLVPDWEDMDRAVETVLSPPGADIDLVVFAVQHDEYRDIDLPKWLSATDALVLDANNVLTATQVSAAKVNNIPLFFVGRG